MAVWCARTVSRPCLVCGGEPSAAQSAGLSGRPPSFLMKKAVPLVSVRTKISERFPSGSAPSGRTNCRDPPSAWLLSRGLPLFLPSTLAFCSQRMLSRRARDDLASAVLNARPGAVAAYSPPHSPSRPRLRRTAEEIPQRRGRPPKRHRCRVAGRAAAPAPFGCDHPVGRTRRVHGGGTGTRRAEHRGGHTHGARRQRIQRGNNCTARSGFPASGSPASGSPARRSGPHRDARRGRRAVAAARWQVALLPPPLHWPIRSEVPRALVARGSSPAPTGERCPRSRDDEGPAPQPLAQDTQDAQDTLTRRRARFSFGSAVAEGGGGGGGLYELGPAPVMGNREGGAVAAMPAHALAPPQVQPQQPPPRRAPRPVLPSVLPLLVPPRRGALATRGGAARAAAEREPFCAADSWHHTLSTIMQRASPAAESWNATLASIATRHQLLHSKPALAAAATPGRDWPPADARM
jgi:hypothetical protein